MPTKQQAEQVDKTNQEGRQLEAAIGEHVLRTLGRPGNLQKVDVRRLWEDHYRVNVFVGADAASIKVAHSYFLVADREGNILESTPRVSGRY